MAHLYPSIVAVHGIGALRATTWTAKREGQSEFINWLSHKTMLPNKVSNIRVLSFGYESAWFDKNVMHTSLLSIGRKLLYCLLHERKVVTKSCPENYVTDVLNRTAQNVLSYLSHIALVDLLP